MTPNLDQERVERAAEAVRLCLRGIDGDARVSELTHGEIESVCRAAITAYLGDTHVVVPREPTEEMWDGLARAIVMWTRFSRPSKAALLKHLAGSGHKIPAWLAAECRDIDHVPPKGSVAVWIYRAMLSATPPATPDGKNE